MEKKQRKGRRILKKTTKRVMPWKSKKQTEHHAYMRNCDSWNASLNF
jgi:hypothetical protein